MLLEFKIIEIKDKSKLNDFVASQKRAEFLQSWQWGEFQERAGNTIFRLGVEDEKGELIAAATLIKKSLGLGLVRRSLGVGGMNYFFCPRGPIILKQNVIPSASEESLKAIKNDKGFLSPPAEAGAVQNDSGAVSDFLFSEIKKLAQKENVIFFRFEPKEEIHHSSFIIHRSIDVEPSKTLMLDLSKSEDELLSAMHQKTRYNIRLAEKKGVKIFISPIRQLADSPCEVEGGRVSSPLQGEGQDEVNKISGGDRWGLDEGFEKFWSLMSETVNRDGFRLHEKEYYKKMLETENVKLLFGFAPRSLGEGPGGYKNKILAAGIFSFFGDTATYIHGASSNENREMMAPYLLQWEAIKMAKNAGCKYYDFFGIDEKKWPGVTRFKRGFSPAGGETDYPGTFDIVFNTIKYNFYQFLRKLRRKF